MFSKKFLAGAALSALSFSIAGHAHAQSTASQLQDDEEIVVTGLRANAEGTMVNEQAPRARASITQDYIETQMTGQTVLETVNLIPGVNFTNVDPYGSSGGAINMRGFDNQRISLTFDGIPLNDTGNYAIYSNQQLDPELIQRANVNLGTTEVDSPTASAVGGTVNYITRVPDAEGRLALSYAQGSWDFQRTFALLDTGPIGPWGTLGFLSASFTEYEQFIGPGSLQKTQFNGGLYQDIGDNGDFIRLSFHYNENRNNFYYRFSEAQYDAGIRENLSSCVGREAIAAGTSGVVDDESADGCSGSDFRSYYNHSINPSNTGNIRGQSRFTLADSLTLTVDPSFQYVRANGGGTAVFSETAPQLIANTTTPGIDLNGDGDFLDSVRLYSPSNTNTYRYGVTSSLIWDLNEQHRVRFGYTWDEGHHRQTGEYGYLRANGDPESVFGGRDGFGRPVINGAGEVFQKRDRTSVASLNQFSAEYRGDFMDDALTLVVGVRAPEFERELNQNCYARRGSGSSTQYCTLETPIPSATSPGFVTFAGSTREYATPFSGTVEYDEVLPNVGVTYRPSESQQIFFSYAEGLSAPQTDDLYAGILVTQLDIPQPEGTQAYDVGYRYQTPQVMASATVWYNQFENRIESSVDPADPNTSIRRNVGDVDLWGAEASVGWNVTPDFFLYGAASWTDSEVKNTGASVVDTPDWTLSVRGEYDFGPLTVGAQANYIGERYANDANTETADAYTVVDLDLRYDFSELFGREGTYAQLNVINLFDEEYFGQMSSGTGTGSALYNLGAPRTFMVTLRTEF